jgi:hypothetical protein
MLGTPSTASHRCHPTVNKYHYYVLADSQLLCTAAYVLQDAGDSEHGRPPLPPSRRIGGYGGYSGGYMGAQSASDQFREASDKLRRLQATAAGPPALKDIITVRLLFSTALHSRPSTTCYGVHVGTICVQQWQHKQLRQHVAVHCPVMYVVLLKCVEASCC